MTTRFLPFLAFVFLLTLVANGLFLTLGDPAPAGAVSRTTLAAASELPGKTKGTVIPEDTEFVQETAALLAGQLDVAGPSLITTRAVAAVALIWFIFEDSTQKVVGNLSRR